MHKTFTHLLMSSFPKARPWIALILVMAAATAPAIPSIPYRVAVLAALGLTIIYLFFDIYKELANRLTRIESQLGQPDPPSYQNFNDAFPAIDDTIKNRLNANQNVKIRILAVTSQYSWKTLIEDRIEEYIKLGNRQQKITIELAILFPSLLEDWGQTKLMIDTERTLKGIDIYIKKLDHDLKTGRLSIEVHKYDNVPNWHGILIDEDTLFFGRSRWTIRGDSMELTIGTNPYRKFTSTDTHNGKDRIVLFVNWFEAYKIRSKFKSNSNASAMLP